jgi:hypothetical protein
VRDGSKGKDRPELQVREGGFYEYFHPTTGNGHSSDFFSWTAALVLDILLQETAKADG